jgi:hypothetical protein
VIHKNLCASFHIKKETAIMPHKLKKESNGLGVVITFSEVVTGDEMQKLDEKLNLDKQFSNLRYRILDFSKIKDIKIRFDELRNYAIQNSIAVRKNPDIKIAIVIRTKSSSGLDSVFHAYEKAWRGYESKTFTDIKTARKWAQSD